MSEDFRPFRQMYRLSMDYLRDRADEAIDGHGEWSMTTQQINDLACDAYTARVDAESWRADAAEFARTTRDTAKERDVLREALRSLVATLPPHLRGRSGAGPGHSHERPGIWDDDNDPLLAGQPCEWCRAWGEARFLLGMGYDHQPPAPGSDKGAGR